MARKRPCAQGAQVVRHGCPRCGKTYSRADSLVRHAVTCAPTEGKDGKDGDDTRAELAELKTQMAMLLRERSAAQAGANAAPAGQHAPPTIVNNMNGANPMVVNNIQMAVVVRPWGSDEGKAIVTADMLNEIFESCPQLREYSDMSFRDQLDPAKSAPHAALCMVELARRAHVSPESRNIYLNPRRSDQVLVYGGGDGWKALTLQEGVRGIFDDLDAGVGRVILSDQLRAGLTSPAEAGATGARTVYGSAPDLVMEQARGQMTAHLGNMAPAPSRRKGVPVIQPAEAPAGAAQ